MNCFVFASVLDRVLGDESCTKFQGSKLDVSLHYDMWQQQRGPFQTFHIPPSRAADLTVQAQRLQRRYTGLTCCCSIVQYRLHSLWFMACLLPCLFNCYLPDLIIAILSTKVGCNIGGLFVNILPHADDVVLLAPSALQLLINMLADCALTIDMLCNTDKTVCMIFQPKHKRKVNAMVKERKLIVLSEIHLRTTARHLSMGSHSVICHPNRAGWYSIYRPSKDERLSWPSWLVTYRDGLPVHKRSPIPALTESDVAQLRWSRPTRYH